MCSITPTDNKLYRLDVYPPAPTRPATCHRKRSAHPNGGVLADDQLFSNVHIRHLVFHPDDKISGIYPESGLEIPVRELGHLYWHGRRDALARANRIHPLERPEHLYFWGDARAIQLGPECK